MQILPKSEKNSPTVEWLFLDLNSYFASVEQQERPELRSRPVGIIPLLTDSTCCIAASYEAKAHGVKTGTGVLEARTLCPHIELVEARPKLYVEYHHRIIDAVNNCLPVTKVLSIDEMACRLMGRERAVSNAIKLAADMKEAIRGVGETLHGALATRPVARALPAKPARPDRRQSRNGAAHQQPRHHERQAALPIIAAADEKGLGQRCR